MTARRRKAGRIGSRPATQSQECGSSFDWRPGERVDGLRRRGAKPDDGADRANRRGQDPGPPARTRCEVAELADGPTGGWLTVSELARVRGVDKAAISRRVARLEAAGALATRPGPRGTKLINADEFARAAAEMTDVVREANGRRAAEARDGDGGGLAVTAILSRQQARRVAYDADIKKLQRDRLLGELARVSDFAAGAAAHGETFARIIDRLPDRTDDLAAVVAKEGSPGLRNALKAIAREWRGALADAFTVAANPSAPPLEEIEQEQADAEAAA